MIEELEETKIAPTALQTSRRMREKAFSKAVVVHAGARDSYELALALAEVGTLKALVTDVFWIPESAWARLLEECLPAAFRKLLLRRSKAGIPAAAVRQCLTKGIRSLLLDRLPRVSFELRRKVIRDLDATLGRKAGRLARQERAGLMTYSYYGYDAISEYGGPSLLFQVHPHPATIRRLLQQELDAHPECATSLLQEWELSLPDEEFKHLVEEPRLASHLIAASTFTRDSLIEHGIAAERITVIPYGIDLNRFTPGPVRTRPSDGTLRLLFVGRINQRKGIKYLLEALRTFRRDEVHLTVCGRVLDDLNMFRQFGEMVEVRPSVSEDELVSAYQAADLFVFPSVAEGFGQVLLEALACALPILSTTHTAAPDLITEGREGFIVEPCRPDLIAERIRWAIEHRSDLADMRIRARIRAEHFTWRRFRDSAASAVGRYLDTLT